jgi:hypothetical protein
MKLEKIPEAIRIDAAKVLASKGGKRLPEGSAKGGTKAERKRIEQALHYLNVSLAIHEDAAVRKDLTRCRKLLGLKEPAKGEADLADIPDGTRYQIGSAVTMRGMSKLPMDWVDEKYGVPPEKLQIAVYYLDIANTIERDLTTMNWRAQCLKLMRRWDDAIAAFRELMGFATGEYEAIYHPLAKRCIRFCEEGRAKDPTPTKSENTAPVADPEYVQLATSFADALVAGNFKKARALLSHSLKRSTSEKALAKSLEDLLPSAQSTIDDSNVVDTMDDWPDKKPGDVGWAYVALNGDGFSEGVSVTVSKEGTGLAIRDVEWGRP